jgi:Glutathione S-transferase, C-terminal domain
VLLNLGKPDVDLSAFDTMLENLDLFETELKSRGSKFFGGEKPAMVDYMIWPWFERFELFAILGGDKLQIPKTRFSRLVIFQNSIYRDSGFNIVWLARWSGPE